MVLPQIIHFYGPNIVVNFHLDWFCSFWDIQYRYFSCILMNHDNSGVAHARYHVIRMMGVTSNPIIWFSHTHVTYSLCNFYGAIIKNNGCFLLTPMLSSSHYRPIENGFSEVEKGFLPPLKKWLARNEPICQSLYHHHHHHHHHHHSFFGCIERQATLLIVSCRCVEGTKKNK